jgi:hypothetical protein
MRSLPTKELYLLTFVLYVNARVAICDNSLIYYESHSEMVPKYNSDRYCTLCKQSFTIKQRHQKRIERFQMNNRSLKIRKYKIQPNIVPDIKDLNSY